MEEELKRFLEEQSKLLKEIRSQTGALHRALVWSRVYGVVRFLLFVVVPLVLLYLYVYPAYQRYTAAVRAVTSGQLKPDQFLNDLPPLLKNALKLQGFDVDQLKGLQQQLPASRERQLRR